ncbi:hypothetical protein BDW_02235 [Bdellovibrio bacteriovorus W]|nr:hypothetical protein BDW_02235 [Bdellovibrio bacteriovorus W]
MKSLVFAIATLIGLSAFAADTKLGNVVAIEREVSGIYEKCLEKVEDTTGERSFFSCAFRYAADTEVQFSKGTAIRLMNEECSVAGDALNGTLLITFSQRAATSNFAQARTCLQKALEKQPNVKVKLFSIE